MTQPYKISNLLLLALLLGSSLCLSGCSTFSGLLDDYYDAPVGPAASQTPLGKVAVMVDYARDPVEPADFVKETRPDPQTVKYLPIKAAHEEHATPLESPESLKALTAALEAERGVHDKLGGREPFKPKPKEEKKKPEDVATKPAPVPTSAQTSNNSLFGIIPLGNGFGNNQAGATQAGANNAAVTNPVPNPVPSVPAQ